MKEALKRAISSGCDYIIMDGNSNNFLREGWNLAIDNGWIAIKQCNDEQDGAMHGYWTDKARKELL